MDFKMASVLVMMVVTLLSTACSMAVDDVYHPNHVLFNYRSSEDVLPGADPGDPLFLTPYITSGQIEQGKNLSRVGALPGLDVVSYSGYLTVDDTYNSNLFFWFFETLSKNTSAPVLLWLQGGPGGSDMFGLFVETGPYRVDARLELVANNYTWATNYNMLYIDNPVGTGWSFSDSDDGYSQNEEDVSNNLDNALRQFFTLFPEYNTNDFYITGESYAGKYIPATAYKVDLNNAAATVKINLKGVAIGNGLVDPITQNDYGNYLYGLGLIDGSQRDFYLEQQELLVQDIQNGDYAGAFAIFDMLLNGDFYPYPTYFKNCTGLNYYYNFLQTEAPIDQDFYLPYILQDSVRAAIHVGGQEFHDDDKVESFFTLDFMNTTKPFVESLINDGYKVMLFNGQLDLIIPYYFTITMIDTMTWDTVADYHAAPRLIWKVDALDIEVAGYARPSHNFVEVLVRDAGHMVPYDQPRVGFDLITRFIEGLPWTN